MTGPCTKGEMKLLSSVEFKFYQIPLNLIIHIIPSWNHGVSMTLLYTNSQEHEE